MCLTFVRVLDYLVAILLGYVHYARVLRCDHYMIISLQVHVMTYVLSLIHI